MRNLIKLLLCLFLLPCLGVAETDAFMNGSATTTGVQTAMQVINVGAYTHVLTYVGVGTTATISIQIEGSTNNGSSYSVCGSASTTLPVPSAPVQCTGIYDHIRVNITTLTGAAPQVLFSLYSSTLSGGTGSAATQVQGTAATGTALVGNPVLVAGSDGTNARVLSMSNTGRLALGIDRAGADGEANNLQATVNSNAAIGADSNRYLGVFPYEFNGTTWDRQGYCSNTTLVNVAATTTQIIALSGSTKVRVCGFVLSGNATAGSFEIVYGTGANCGTGTTSFGLYNVLGTVAPPVSYSPGITGALTTPAGQALCVKATTTTVTGTLIWGQW